MSVFKDAGTSMMMAAEGNAQLAEMMLAGVKGWIASFRGWLSNMPTTLPPTESIRR